MPENKELPSLKELGKKIDKAKREINADESESRAPSATNVSIDLLGGVIGGSLAGYYLDKWLGTTPFLFIICFFLGVAGAVRNILRSIRNVDNLDNENTEKHDKDKK